MSTIFIQKELMDTVKRSSENNYSNHKNEFGSKCATREMTYYLKRLVAIELPEYPDKTRTLKRTSAAVNCLLAVAPT